MDVRRRRALVAREGVKTLEFWPSQLNFVENQIYEDLTASWIIQSNDRKFWINNWRKWRKRTNTSTKIRQIFHKTINSQRST